jgi:hypothetical protein
MGSSLSFPQAEKRRINDTRKIIFAIEGAMLNEGQLGSSVTSKNDLISFK